MKKRKNPELTKATQLITRIAEKHDVSEDAVRADLLEAMRASKNCTDPLVQEKWKAFNYTGEEPSADEFLAWVLSLAADRNAD